jgi:hypothetical protein
VSRRVLALAGSAVLLIAAALLVTHCGGDDNGPPDDDGNAGPTSVEGTPLSFEEQRDGLVDQLDAIGSNTGAVPADVRLELVSNCENLLDLAERDTVERLCSAIEQAIVNDDPDLMDAVVREMRLLEED